MVGKLLYMNINGLSDFKKQELLFDFISISPYQIFFLVETRLAPHCTIITKLHPWIKADARSTPHDSASGILILQRPNSSYLLNNIIIHSPRFVTLLLNTSMLSAYNIGIVYGPHKKKKLF